MIKIMGWKITLKDGIYYATESSGAKHTLEQTWTSEEDVLKYFMERDRPKGCWKCNSGEYYIVGGKSSPQEQFMACDLCQHSVRWGENLWFNDQWIYSWEDDD